MLYNKTKQIHFKQKRKQLFQQKTLDNLNVLVEGQDALAGDDRARRVGGRHRETDGRVSGRRLCEHSPQLHLRAACLCRQQSDEAVHPLA